MARKFLTPIDLTGLELQNFKVQNLATDPSAYGKGHTYYNTAHNELRVYDGSAWQPVGGAIAYGNTASRPAAGNAGNAYADTQTQTLYIDNGTAWVQIGVNSNDVSTAISNAALGSTDNLSEGTTNLYYTDTRARNAVSATTSQGLSYDSGTGVFSVDYTSLESTLVTDGFAKTSDIPNAQSIANEVAGDLVTGSTYLTTGTNAGNTYVDLNLSTLETQLVNDSFAKLSDISANYITAVDSNIFNVDSGTLQLNSVVEFTNGELHLRKTEYWNGGTQYGIITNNSNTFKQVATQGDFAIESNNGWVTLYGDSGVKSLSNFYTDSGYSITSGNNLYVKAAIYVGGTDQGADGSLNIQDSSGNNTFVVSATSGAATVDVHGTQNFYASQPDGGTEYGQISYDSGKNLIINANNNDLIITTDSGYAYIGNNSSPATRIATQSYVDSVAQGLNVKNSVLMASAAAVNLSTWNADGGLIDGVDFTEPGQRALLKDQADSSENGIYVVNSDGYLVRASDEQTPAKGDFVFVEAGTANGKTGWILSDVGSGTTYTWTQFSAAGEYTAGDGIDISGNAISVKLDGDSLSKSGTGLKVNLSSTGAIETDGGLYVNTGSGLTINGSNQLTVDTSVVVEKYATLVGDGTNTSFTVTHNFGTRDVVVSVYDAATYEEVMTDVTRTNTNAVSVGFAVAPSADAYRVVVHA